jgi:FkbM family methyltransferase
MIESGMPVPAAIFENDYTAMKSCKHGFFLFNKNDSFIGRSLNLYGEWCEEEIVLLSKVIRPGFLVIDVGANIGTHTVPLANMVTSSGLVLAFEPQSLPFRYMVSNVTINNLLHVVCFNKAVGDAAGSVKIPMADPTLEYNFGAIKATGHTEGIPTDVVTLDSFGLNKCNLIKIDVEGMEPQVLDGARTTIQRLRPTLFVETTMENSRGVIERLTRFRYESWWHISEYYNPNNFFNNPDNIFRNIHPETNLLCFPKEANFRVAGLEKVVGVDDNWQAALKRMRPG